MKVQSSTAKVIEMSELEYDALYDVVIRVAQNDIFVEQKSAEALVPYLKQVQIDSDDTHIITLEMHQIWCTAKVLHEALDMIGNTTFEDEAFNDYANEEMANMLVGLGALITKRLFDFFDNIK